MNIQLIDIQVTRPDGGPDGSARVLVDVDGVREWFDFEIHGQAGLGGDASIITPPEALYDRLTPDHTTVHRICSVVGQASRDGGVHLPLLVAA